MNKNNELPRGVMGGIIPVVVGAARQVQQGSLDWVWARWPRGFSLGGRTPDCALMVPWSHWWWHSGKKNGETRVEVVHRGERADRQEWLFSDYEDMREEQERRAPNGRGFMFDGLVVAGWLCWHEERPVLSGVEPVSLEVAEWVYRLDGRSMVGPGRLTSGPKGEDDMKLEKVLPAAKTPRDAFGTGLVQNPGSEREESRASRSEHSPASSRRSRANGDGF